MSHLVSAILMQAKRLAEVDPATALDLCDRVADLAADRDDYCLVRGQCHLAVNDVDGARFWIARAMALGSDDPAGLAALAGHCVAAGNPGAGRSLFRTALALFPQVPELHAGLAHAELDGNAAVAERAAGRALRLDPALPDALTNAGVLAYRRGDHEVATGRLRRALAADPALAAAQVNLGTVLQSWERSGAAEAVLRRALRLAPESAEAINSLGVSALSRGDTDAAEAWFRRAIALHPTYSEALFNLGSLRQGLGDVLGAHIIYGRADADSFRAIGLFNTGLAHIAEERFAEAKAALCDAVTLAPADAGIRNQLAVAFAGLKRKREAMAAVRAALCLSPDAPEFYYNGGLAAYNAEETWASLTAYKRAILLDFHSPELAFSGIGLTKLQSGDGAAGEEALKLALALAPDAPRSYTNIGPALQLNGKPQEGVQAFARALRCVKSDPADIMLSLGQSHMSQGNIEEGLVHIRRSLAFKPDTRLGLFCVGYALMDRDRPAEAEIYFARAVRVDPSYCLGWNNYGAALYQQGRLDEAVECFQKLVGDDQNYAQAHLNLAIAYENGKRLVEAEHSYRLVIQHDPSMVTAWNNLGVLLQRTDRHAEAQEVLEKAVQASAESPGIHTNLGNLHQKLGNAAEATRCYRRAVALDPAYHLGHYNLGCVLLDAERYEECLPHFRRAAAIDPDHLSSRYNLACALHQIVDFEGAIPLYREVVAADGGHYRALNNLALALQWAGQTAESAEMYKRAERVAQRLGIDPAAPGGLCAPDADRLDEVRTRIEASEDQVAADAGPLQQGGVGSMFPAAVWNKSLLDLSIGNLGAGWDGYEFRWFNATANENRKFRQPLWDGRRDIAGKRLLVWREQGIGDEIMFASCIPDLAATGAQVTLECSPKLLALFRHSFPGVRVVGPSDRPDEARDDFDVHLPMGSLPRFYRRDFADFPKRKGFLAADPARVAHWRRYLESLGPGPYLGMVWRGRVQTLTRSHHYTRIEDWEPILRMPGIRLINMQYDDTSDEVAWAQALFGAAPHTPQGIDMWNDLAEVAALLEALDLLFTVSTAVMSIAGAVGVPTWHLGLENFGWPCLGTDHMPWYPNMRLITRNLRQPWASVVQSLADELEPLLPTLGRAPAGAGVGA